MKKIKLQRSQLIYSRSINHLVAELRIKIKKINKNLKKIKKI